MRSSKVVLIGALSIAFSGAGFLAWAARQQREDVLPPPERPAVETKRPLPDPDPAAEAAVQMTASIKLVNAVDSRIEGVGSLPLDIQGEVYPRKNFYAPTIRCNVRIDVFADPSRALVYRYDFDPFVVERGVQFTDRFQRQVKLLPGSYIVQVSLRDLDYRGRDQLGNDISEENRTMSSAGYHATVN